TRCDAHDLNFTSWNSSVSSGVLPNYAFIGPNATHSCWKKGFGVSICDAWLKSWLSPLVNDSFFNSSVFFITYDEGQFGSTLGANGSLGGGHVYFTAVSPYACPGYVSYYNYTAFNLLTTTEWLLGLGQLGQNDSWVTHPPMTGLFCFPSNWTVGGGGGLVHGLHRTAGPDAPLSPIATRRPEARDV
ncbi:MAG: alkaline phosphatase family protein, partial [Thermoplasmata archaeon]|nr:alkaline phosphatase family protein [Thermoplasmata archaeon]